MRTGLHRLDASEHNGMFPTFSENPMILQSNDEFHCLSTDSQEQTLFSRLMDSSGVLAGRTTAPSVLSLTCSALDPRLPHSHALCCFSLSCVTGVFFPNAYGSP